MRNLPCCIALAMAAVASASAQVNPQLFSDMKWRGIGPLRAGRTRAVAGVPSQPHTFYIGAVNGGVWKTDDAGTTWKPLFEEQPSGSIGAIAVSPSNPDIIYVGSGEGLMRPDLSVGDGMYKSINGGKTWAHIGLFDAQQIPNIALDARNPDRLFVAALGHPYGANEERGIFRSLDGGKTFQKVLYIDANTGGSEVKIDPNNPDIVWAGMWQGREGAWENGRWGGVNGGLFKSTNGGNTWTKVTGGGLPDNITQVDVAIAPTNSNRIYLTAATGQPINIYRSDDGGKTWIKPTTDPRPAGRIGGGDTPVPVVDPKNPDVLYIASTVTWRSADAGKTWTGIRGAPGGDDYQNLWINPLDPKIICLTSDQGGVVTFNAGDTWTSWYNQPTAQMYHVTLDNAFPYRACSGQQDSGSACVDSRGNDGIITSHDWHPVGVEEYGYAAPDPLDPDLVFGGKVTRYDRRTGQITNVDPKPLREYRVLRTAPLVFSKADPHMLLFAANSVWKTLDRGNTWSEISPDLTRKTFDLPESLGIYRNDPTTAVTQRGVIYSLAPSPLNAARIWAGTDDGLIWTTADGGAHWNNVTPPEMKPFWQVSSLDASPFDALTAYAAINTLRLDDMHPHLFKTHDGGKNWTAINEGIGPAASRVVREDPKRKGLLYAGTETQVWTSFDDGAHWQSLRLNMAATSIRDLQVKDDDLVAGTHGRGFQILDNVTPLRQLSLQTQSEVAYLYKPATAIRVRGNMNPPTPWPPETPSGQNPPDGAIFDYYLGANATGPVTLEILDSAGKLVRKYSSTDPVTPLDPLTYPVPLYWARQPRALAATPGHHRWVWDLFYTPVTGMNTGPDADQAVPGDTPSVPTSPFANPGAYTAKLTAGGKTLTQTFTIKMDPRVKTTAVDWLSQFTVSKQLYDGMQAATTALGEIAAAPNSSGNQQLQALGGGVPPSFSSVRGQLQRVLRSIQSADSAPTAAQRAAANKVRADLDNLLKQWSALKPK